MEKNTDFLIIEEKKLNETLEMLKRRENEEIPLRLQ